MENKKKLSTKEYFLHTLDKNTHYYDYTRNCSCCGAFLCRKIEEQKEDINSNVDGNVVKNISVPSYYIGNNGYEARKVISGFDLSYNVGTATTYLLRCGKKTEQGMTDKDKHIEDIEKAMNHLRFELERLRDEH